MDVPQRCADARHRLGSEHPARGGGATRGGLVPGGGMAVVRASRNWSGGETLWRGYTAIDLATAAYVLVATCAVLYSFHGEGIPGWPWLLTAHALIGVLVVLAPRARTAGAVGRF